MGTQQQHFNNHHPQQLNSNISIYFVPQPQYGMNAHSVPYVQNMAYNPVGPAQLIESFSGLGFNESAVEFFR